MRKEAQFVEGFVNKLVKEFGPEAFSNRPFETIFKALGSVMIWRFSKLLGLLSFGLEAFGMGPSVIGKIIDKHLGTGKEINLSEANLQQAAVGVSNDLVDLVKTQLETSAADDVLNDIIKIKGCLEPEDIVSAIYVSKFVKIAKKPSRKKPGRIGFLRRFLNLAAGGRRVGLANILFGILKTFALGILGVSAATGLASYIKGEPVKTERSVEKPIGTYYANDARNVETTILLWLDKIEGFYKVFKQMKPNQELTQSKGFQKLLKIIEKMNSADIETINNWNAFVGPSPKEMVQIILPGAIYESVQKPKQELKKLLREVL